MNEKFFSLSCAAALIYDRRAIERDSNKEEEEEEAPGESAQ